MPNGDNGRFSLISLYQLVLEYPINDLVLMLTGLLSASSLLRLAKEPQEPIPDPEWLSKVSVALDGLHKLGAGIEIDSSLREQIARLKDDVGKENCQVSAIVIKTRLDSIIEGIQNNLNLRRFMYVPKDQAEYWENPELFGEDFLIASPKQGLMEMMEAGCCFAAGRWTACVFHSMRVAELGLRRLAKGLRVTISS
jgi:hypothetical protein